MKLNKNSFKKIIKEINRQNFIYNTICVLLLFGYTFWNKKSISYFIHTFFHLTLGISYIIVSGNFWLTIVIWRWNCVCVIDHTFAVITGNWYKILFIVEWVIEICLTSGWRAREGPRWPPTRPQWRWARWATRPTPRTRKPSTQGCLSAI